MIGQLHENSDGFAETMLPHLDSAYNLARWLVQNAHGAEDVAQEAYLRALRYFDSFHGGDARAWLLTIVRNTGYRWLQDNRARQATTDFDEQFHSGGIEDASPETFLIQNANHELVEQALRNLPVRLREVLVLRELQDLSYKEISGVIGVPMGTVMSRLSRARQQFRHAAGVLLRSRRLPKREEAFALIAQ
jgi:RNA polymerase sigma-70 factor (ECF subfamily)